jgi:hypothetical protein
MTIYYVNFESKVNQLVPTAPFVVAIRQSINQSIHQSINQISEDTYRYDNETQQLNNWTHSNTRAPVHVPCT